MIVKLEFTKHFLFMSILMIFVICLFDNAFAENGDNKQWKNYFLGKVIDNNSSKSDQLFKFQLQVQNGIIDKITQNSKFEGLVANVSSSGNETLEIKFPRNYPFMQGYNNMSEHYAPNVYFLINKMEGNYTMSKSDCFFAYSVPFSGNSEVDMLISHPLISNLPNMYHGDNISPSCNVQTIVSYMPPLKQINAGIDPKNVQCVVGLVAILHPENNTPVCVKPDTANILIERGWTKSL